MTTEELTALNAVLEADDTIIRITEDGDYYLCALGPRLEKITDIVAWAASKGVTVSG